MQLSRILGIIFGAGVLICEARKCYLSSCGFEGVVKWTLPKQNVSGCTQVTLDGHSSRCPCGNIAYVFDKPFALAADVDLQEILRTKQSKQTLDFGEMTCLHGGKVHGNVKDVFECNDDIQPSGLPITTSVAAFQSSIVVHGSCVDRCGLQYMENFSCQCDFVCSKFNDCCSDFSFYCDRNDSCFGRCGLGFKESYSCQCNFACTNYNDCCSDYNDTCSRNNSCLGKCGLKYNEKHSCHCNFACTKYKDCCSDYNDTCVTGKEDTGIPAGFCSRHGCFDYDKTQPCQCDPYCHAYNNCCPDFEAHGCNTCRKMGGCISYDKGLPCQCNPKCMTNNDCCSDFGSLCSRNVSQYGERNETSCAGRCDAPLDKTNFTCQCNSACNRYNDCCGDYIQQCRNSCLGRCGVNLSQGEACKCDNDCRQSDNCCEDYDIYCPPREDHGITNKRNKFI